MAVDGRVSGCCDLRSKCLVIGYMNLVVCVVDITCHVLIAAIVSGGFQCDVNRRSLSAVDWPWLEPFLLLLNLGTHGFFAFPMILRSNGNYIEHIPLPQRPKCYPGMLHVYLIDILILLINIVWLKFVVMFIFSVHKKERDSMKMFFHLSLVKLILQIIYFAYEPYEPTIQNTFPMEIFWMLRLADIVMATGSLLIIYVYIDVLRRENLEKLMSNTELLTSSIDILIASEKPQDYTPDRKKEDLGDVAMVCDNSKPAELKLEEQ